MSQGAYTGFLVLDVVFEGQSLNYDQSAGGNVQQLKKIHMGGRVYTMVSRYAIRYSLLETGERLFGWRLADREALSPSGSGGKQVIQPNPSKLCQVLDYVDLDLFGFLATGERKDKGEGKERKGGASVTIARPSPVKISHAISMEPYKFDSHFNVNLGLARRAGQLGEVQNPFQVEEHRSYYKYSVVVDLQSVGHHWVLLGKDVPDYLSGCSGTSGDQHYYEVVRDAAEERRRVLELVASVISLVRSIKGRAEDLSPRLMLAAYYPKLYRSFLDGISLRSETSRETRIEELEEGGKRIVRVVESQWDSPRIHVELPGAVPDHFLMYRRASNVDAAGIPEDMVTSDPAVAIERIGGWIGCDDHCIGEVKDAMLQKSQSEESQSGSG
ncbi:MAG: type I-B CRISPR-associated protein Cas7/Cst2/DevR [Conexivisphaera sp.]